MSLHNWCVWFSIDSCRYSAGKKFSSRLTCIPRDGRSEAMGSNSTSSSSSDDDDPAARARAQLFASIAETTELALNTQKKRGSREQNRDIATRLSSAPNLKIAESLDRMIGAALTFGNAVPVAQVASTAVEGGEATYAIRLFRKGPTVSGMALDVLNKQKGPLAPRRVVDRLPKHRLVDLEAVFEDQGATRGVVVDGRQLADNLEMYKKRNQKERNDRKGQTKRKQSENGVVVVRLGKVQERLRAKRLRNDTIGIQY